MYRDDDEALFQRADALQREVDALREELAKERARYVPTTVAPRPPPIPPALFAKRKLPKNVEPTTTHSLARINEELDHLGDPTYVRIDDVITRLRALDGDGLRRVAELLDHLLGLR